MNPVDLGSLMDPASVGSGPWFVKKTKKYKLKLKELRSHMLKGDESAWELLVIWRSNDLGIVHSHNLNMDGSVRAHLESSD